jgi:hypothetical protein
MENIFTDNLNAILAGVITTLLTIIGIVAQRYLSKIKKNLDLQTAQKTPEEAEEDMGFSLWCDRAIMDIIAETRVKTDSARAYVIRFHNGTYFSNRQPIWKLTCTHESTAKGVEYLTTKDVQSLPASNVLDIIVPFWGGISRGVKRIDIPDPTVEGDLDPRNGVYLIDTEQMDSSMGKQLLRSEGVTCAMNIPLVSPKDGRILGLFGLDCLDSVRTFSPEEIEMLKDVADRISYILCREKDESVPNNGN